MINDWADNEVIDSKHFFLNVNCWYNSSCKIKSILRERDNKYNNDTNACKELKIDKNIQANREMTTTKIERKLRQQ